MGGRVHVYGRGVGRCDSFAGGEGDGEGGLSLYRLRDMGWRDGLCGWRRICLHEYGAPRHNAANAVTPCPGACHRPSPHGA